MSLVLMQPSESMRSNESAVAVRRASSACSAVMTASVVTTTSMVASAGASMPAPLAMPPTVNPSMVTLAVLATVSVVMIATAASAPPSADSTAVAASTPASRSGIGRRSPMRPVEQTPTSPGPVSSPAAVSTAATCSAVTCVSAKPSGPVQALAPPEFSTTARSRPSATACCDHRTGAALNRLPVNTPAAASSGPSFTTRARSGRPDALMPAVTPAARKPFGLVTVTGRLRSR